MLNLKSYFNFLDRNKVYTFINLFGLSVGLMFVIVLGLYTQQEFNRDTIHRKSDRIYVLGSEKLPEDGSFGGYSEGSHWAMPRRLKDRFPEIEDACAITSQEVKVKSTEGNDFVNHILCVDANFYEFFDFPLEVGDKTSVLRNLNSMVITRKMASTLFGDVDPLGKNVTLNDSINFVISGIAGSMEGWSAIAPHDIIINFEGAGKYLNEYLTEPRMNAYGSASVFLLEKKNTDLKAKEQDMADYAKEIVWWFQNQYAGMMPQKLSIFPLKGLYFHKDLNSYSTAMRKGNQQMVNLLALAGLVILVFSVMNYINLTVAQSGFRMREMAMRRLIGTQRWELILRLMAESVLLCFIALLIAVLFTIVGLPHVNQLLNTNLQWTVILHPLNICLALVFILLLGFVSGVFPSLVTSAAKPIEVVRGTFRRRTKMLFSKVFIVAQHVITIVLVAVALIMTIQIRHMIKAPLGYDTHNLMNLVIYHSEDKMPTFAEEVRRLPGVKGVSIGMTGTPLYNFTWYIQQKDSKYPSVGVLRADSAYMNVVGLKVQRDYHSVDANGDSYYVTQELLAKENLPEDSPYFYQGERQLPVSGVVEDFHLGHIAEEYEYPVYVHLTKNPTPWNLIVRVEENAEQVYDDICRVYKEVYHMEPDFDYPYLDQYIEAQYKDHQRYLDLISLFALVAILISLLGLQAMSIYYIQQRKREIAIRKVFGSSSEEIMWRLVRSFVLYVVLGFVLAVPIIHYFMSDWLSQFSYRIPLYWWIFAVAGLFSLVISLLTVWVQSWKAANSNPIETIRHL